MKILDLRREYHRQICSAIVRFQKDGETDYLNFADKGNKASRLIAKGIADRIGYHPDFSDLTGQTAGGQFERITRDFIRDAFSMLNHLRPGNWIYLIQKPISEFNQYEHLANLEKIVSLDHELASSLGTDYIIKPDILIGRLPVSDEEVNTHQVILSEQETVAQLTPIRTSNQTNPSPILHASISCKWTLRSDRGQNARTEALNLIRNRKGRIPHIVSITAEPLPTRIASLALGTGDLDCVYHFALPELEDTIKEINNEDQLDMLHTLIKGKRLRDIADLPFDLAI